MDAALPLPGANRTYMPLLVLAAFLFAIIGLLLGFSFAAAAPARDPGVAVLLSASVQSSMQMEIDRPSEGEIPQARIRSNSAFSLYGMGELEQYLVLHWKTPSREFVVGLKPLEREDVSGAQGVPASLALASSSDKVRFVVIQP